MLKEFGQIVWRISQFPEWQIGWKFTFRKKLMLFLKDGLGFIFERVVQVINLLTGCKGRYVTGVCCLICGWMVWCLDEDGETSVGAI